MTFEDPIRKQLWEEAERSINNPSAQAICTQKYAPCIGGPANGHKMDIGIVRNLGIVSVPLQFHLSSVYSTPFEVSRSLEFTTAAYESRHLIVGSSPPKEFWFLIPAGSKVEDAIGLMLEIYGD